MRILAASTQGAGHFGSLVPFLESALGRGTMSSSSARRPSIHAAFPFRRARRPRRGAAPVWDSMPRQPPAQGEVVVVGHIFARLNVQAMLGPITEAIESGVPIFILREPAEFASAIAAEMHGVSPASRPA